LKNISQQKVSILVKVIGTNRSKIYHIDKQSIYSSADITEDISIALRDCTGRGVRLAFDCPPAMQVDREEIYEAKMKGKIFVFGSNLAGIHGAGAALDAKMKYGAVIGVGEGHTGNSYAIPTKNLFIETLPLEAIEASVYKFITYATRNPELSFFVTRIGCGLAGYSEEEISPFFDETPDNCILPYGW
jgi:hypothetical protein